MTPMSLARIGALLLALPLAPPASAAEIGGFPMTAPSPAGSAPNGFPSAPGGSSAGGFPSAPGGSRAGGGFPAAPGGSSAGGGFPAPVGGSSAGAMPLPAASGGFPAAPNGSSAGGFTAPPPADGAQWLTSLSGVPGMAGSIATLIFGVPETDDSTFIASCEAGGMAVAVTLYVNAELSDGQPVSLFISDGQSGAPYSGVVSNGMATGVNFEVDVTDPLWTVVQGFGQLSIAVPNAPPMSLPLDGAAPQVQAFLSACAMQFAGGGGSGSGRVNPAGPPPSDVGPWVVAPPPEALPVTPTVFPLGKWAEGLAYDGRWLWAAESGQRTIAKVDPNTGRVMARPKVGRLPVSMASAGDGVTYAMVFTDKTLWRQSANGKGAVFARLASCPQDMTLAGNTPWVLVMPDCSSAESQLVRIDPRSGKQALSPKLGEWGQAAIAAGDQIWVAHARGPAISVTEQGSMRTSWIDAGDASLWSLTTNGFAVYGGGREGGNNDAGLVVMFDPQTQAEDKRISVPERVAEIASDDRHVVAVGAKGTIWVLSAQDLSPLRTYAVTTGEFEPRAALLLGNTLLVTAGTYDGESGAILAVDLDLP